MKAVLIALGALLLLYVGSVVYFEASIGVRQREFPGTVVITTYDSDGAGHRRVVSLLEGEDGLYVAANHWPRAWYRRALEQPTVRVARDGSETEYRAVPLEGADHERVAAEFPLSFRLRFRMGFAPRAFLRLDPLDT